MKKRFIINIVSLAVIILCLSTVSYAWFIDSSIGSKVIIKSANISSEITLYKGNDFNFDGNLDLDEEGNDIYNIVEKTNKNEKQILALDFGTTLPCEVHTWKINVTNKGDADGYVYATLHEGLFDSSNYKLVKYMSITSGDTKTYINGSTSTTILFGGTQQDIVKIGQSRDYVFKIQLEAFSDLVENGICEQSDYEEYQSLQGMITSTSFEFLNVSLSSSLQDVQTFKF